MYSLRLRLNELKVLKTICLKAKTKTNEKYLTSKYHYSIRSETMCSTISGYVFIKKVGFNRNLTEDFIK